ncbi:hypothetical protein FB45DRAFT_67418 [Roridomyces roridus]|uniref:F-box domain-containing protein n=1 Tax=Roridomyces roridus TaxID=1738132 RepID=A0AAD7BML4_9AGAR|nr:hypothetical protein FB45DRAFT_67418 [Roridomyces roridus]
MATRFPNEIWAYIATLLPVACLLRLSLVNSTLHGIARRTWYKSVKFDSYKDAKQIIKQLKDSKEVQAVHIQPWVVLAKTRCSSWSSKWRFLNACISPTLAFDETEDAQILRRLQKQTQRIANAIKAFPHLHEYHIDWDEKPIHYAALTSLVGSVIPHIGHKLSCLSLKVPLEYMHSLPALARHLPNLDSLAVTIHTGAYIPSYICQTIEGLVFFINIVLRHLRSLSIATTWTSTHLVLGPFFEHLGHGPRLKSFSLCLPYDGGHLDSNPGPLREFLAAHRLTLESLSLGTTTRATFHPTPSTPTARFWIRETLKDHVSFPALSRLSLSLRPLRTELGPLTRCLTKLQSQLRALKLSDRALECSELTSLLVVLGNAPLLSELSLRVQCLSPDIVDLLAMHLPNLRVLHMNFTEIIHQEPASSESSLSHDSHSLPRESELAMFCDVLRGKQYPEWGLACIAIRENPRGPSWFEALQRAFFSCIPGLTSFEELVSPV